MSLSKDVRSGAVFFSKILSVLVMLTIISVGATYADGGPILLSRRDGVIYLIPDKGLSPMKIAGGFDPDMGPDGRSLVYIRENVAQNGDESWTICIKNIRTDSVRSVLTTGDRIMLPSWSPDGSHIAFLMFDSEFFWGIHVVKADGSDFRRIAGDSPRGSGPSLSGAPAWWPDGKSVLTHDIQVLYRFTLDGSEMERTPLERFTGKKDASTSTDRFLPHPVRSDIMAFTMSVPGTPLFEKTFNEPNQALFVIDLKTNARKRLTPEDMLATDIHWSKSGDLIFFSGYRDANMNEAYPFRIYSADVETGKITEICSGEQPSQ